MPTLRSIEDLKTAPKRLFQKLSLLDRIESVLEDLNLGKAERPVFPALELSLNHGDRRVGVFHASSVGGQSGKSLCGRWPMGCARELYYSLRGDPTSYSREPRNQRILDTGSAIHLQLQTYLLAAAKSSGGTEIFTMEVDIDPAENKIADEFDLSGHTDGIYEVDDGTDQIRVGVEIKTINDAGYKGLNSPHKEHQVQATIYQKCLDLPVMIFLYYNKNDSSMAEFQLVYDAAIWEAVERKLDHVREAIFDKRTPEQEVSRSCMYCNYKTLCNPPRSAPRTSQSRSQAFRRK